MYRYETHCHATPCSACAHSNPQDLVRAYKSAGYAGLVLTDHFIHGNTGVSRSLPWADRMMQYHQAYLEAKKLGGQLDFDVIFGLEHAYGGGLEVLVYGIDLDFLLANPDIPELDILSFAKRVHDYGGILIHAHPYRWADESLELPLDILDGIEVWNAGNPPDKNALAQALADQTDLIQTSGSDLHSITEPKLGTAGITLPYRATTMDALLEALKQRHHGLILPLEAVTD